MALARAHEDETWLDAAAWSEGLADSYLASGRVDDAVRTIGHATRRGYAEGRRETADLLVADAASATPAPAGSSPCS